MPKATGIPKTVLADINRLKTRLNSLERTQSLLAKEFKSSMKVQIDAMKKHEQAMAQLGKKVVKKEKRKPSSYNLFLKEKMSQGKSMVEAVRIWKERAGMPIPPPDEEEGSHPPPQ